MKILVVSPHLDDAVLSFGGAIAAEDTDVIVATVLAGVPPEWWWPSPFDSACGFRSSHIAVTARRDEDEIALAELFAAFVHLEFLDGQYQMPVDFSAMVRALFDLIEQADYVVVPLGVVHPDHRLVAKACRKALLIASFQRRVEIMVYADLPNSKLHPGHVAGALRGWRRAGFDLEPFDFRVDLEAKRLACERYKSQLRFPELAFENLTEEHGWLATLNNAD